MLQRGEIKALSAQGTAIQSTLGSVSHARQMERCSFRKGGAKKWTTRDASVPRTLRQIEDRHFRGMEPGIAAAFDTSFATAEYLMPWLARRHERHAPSAAPLIAGVSDY